MPVELIVQGGSITLDESEKFNKWRHRLNKAKKMMIDYENGNIDGTSKDQKFEPFHLLTGKTEEGGRVSIDPAKVIGITSDEAKDIGSAADDEEWDDDDDDEGEDEDEDE